MRIHDKYVLGDFLRNLAIGLLAFTVIYVTVDVTDQINVYLDNHARFLDVVLHYAYRIPWILVLIMPVSVLLATVFSLGRLSKLNELTAFISSGTPLTRIASPIIVSSLIVSIIVMVLGEFVIPETNRKSLHIKRVTIQGEKEDSDSRYRSNVHYQGEQGRTYYAENYDVVLKALVNPILYEYEGGKLKRRIDSKKAFWDGARWVFIDGAVREFRAQGEKVTPFDKLPMPELRERPEDFTKEEIDPEEMNFRQLRVYIDRLARSGGPIDKYRVDLYFKFSFPLTNLIFAVIGAALSSAKRKPSMATGFGQTLFISFAYFGVLRIGQGLGHSGVIDPLLGAWLGNIVFIGIGGFLLYRANQ
ncbi:MAG: LptF/LptG family permease [Candidatus Krumholzibacteria bacterium]|nr:LptF/LptG family permease [Candidatus Krumholzibacteria bacterium]